MNEDDAGVSGNRWEPTQPPAHQDRPAQEQPQQEQPQDQPAPWVPEYAAAEPAVPAARAPWLTKARTAVAGGAAAVLLAGGLGGFAIGRATAGGDDDQVRFDQQGGPVGFDRDGDGDRGFGGDGDGFPDGGPGPGTGPGQVPGTDGQQGLGGSDTEDS